MKKEDIIIVGGGPCGLSAAIALMDKGFHPVVIEKANVVNAIYHYPTHQTFFSTSEKLEIGDVPFVTVERKPKRNQALSYYRDVVKRKKIRVQTYEKVLLVEKQKDHRFIVTTTKGKYDSKAVVIATGYYDNPNYMGIPGEGLEHVFHYFKEAHPYFRKNVVVIGGKNSAVDAALELENAGANVTVLYRGEDYSSSVKPWILPEFVSLINNEKINMRFKANVKEITETKVRFEVDGQIQEVAADFVFAMTGYHPDHSFLKKMGVTVDHDTGRPFFHEETMETNVKGIFIAGVIAAGNEANEIFIENGRFHGGLLAEELSVRMNKNN
ncbi:YpdA family putative bacillithiol disulfide reductase [Alkalihalobacillus sp. LMS39]|uniref:YpdA family putative bacillithiol disulfide reductase n=1 Tax=Alkalihalobacillus sp. LMS39 TaxID=2924032 RepID=UPI001FB2F2D9|nr:YpdA family putative bacillithiol disulfide reductase [Alkalihalobacillus sp. LMS39]UOE92370.1 YpdA family putative bacillithiol disulfide reductase [Alkalihalobacillus sp. LMS39]